MRVIMDFPNSCFLFYSVPNVIFVLRRTGVAIICNVTIANTIFAGCVLETGKLMAQNITNALDTKKILI